MFEKLRKSIIEKYADGDILDIGCGYNKIRGAYGVDLYSCDADYVGFLNDLELKENSFDVVVLSATLNYIDNDRINEILSECYRVCRDELIITCITPLGGLLHRFFRKDQPTGMSPKYIIKLVERYGFKLSLSHSFMCFLNRIYIFEKRFL